MSYEIDKTSRLIFPIGIFAIVGTGIGLTGAVLISMLSDGNTIFSGLIVLVILAVSLLLGPIVASIVGIQMSNREHGFMPVRTVFGCSTGFIVMMFVVLLMLFLGVTITSIGGTGAEAGGATSPITNSSGGGFDVTQYLLPIILVAVPTGLAGGAANYLNNRSTISSSTDDAVRKDEAASVINIPVKYVIGGILGVILIASLGYGSIAVLDSPADNLEVRGEGYSQGNTLYADAMISNPGDKRATASMTVQMNFKGEVKESFTSTEEITVESGGSIQKSFEFGTYSELTSTEEEALQNGNFVIEFLINGEVKDTYTE